MNIKNEAKQGDLYQIITYASKAGLEDVYLLYPIYRNEENEEIFPVADSDFELFGITIRIHFIRIPFAFEINAEEKTRSQLMEVISSVFDVAV